MYVRAPRRKTNNDDTDSAKRYAKLLMSRQQSKKKKNIITFAKILKTIRNTLDEILEVHIYITYHIYKKNK